MASSWLTIIACAPAGWPGAPAAAGCGWSAWALSQDWIAGSCNSPASVRS